MIKCLILLIFCDLEVSSTIMAGLSNINDLDRHVHDLLLSIATWWRTTHTRATTSYLPWRSRYPNKPKKMIAISSGRIFYSSGRQIVIYHAFFLMTSSVHTSLGHDKVAFKVSLSVIVMNKRVLISAIVIFPRRGNQIFLRKILQYRRFIGNNSHFE